MSIVVAPSGPVRFARFALPPNELGYCGPSSDGSFAHHLGDGNEAELRALASGFEGAYPYLRLLAGANGHDDPLDPDVVEAYWIGNRLLDNVSVREFGQSIDDRFRRRAGAAWGHVDEAIADGAPNHCFHVLRVMPWAGLIRDGIVDEPLHIVDRCRISWATALSDAEPGDGRQLRVRRRPLVWSGSRLVYGEPVVEDIGTAIPARAGDVVAVHWDWACEQLTPGQLWWLRTTTERQLVSFHAG